MSFTTGEGVVAPGQPKEEMNMNNNNNYYKNKLYSQLFQTRVIKVRNNWENVGVKVILECTDQRLVAHMNKLYKKYKRALQSKADFNSEYMLWAWRAIERFEINDPGESWAQLLNGNSPVLLGKVIKNIKRTTEHEIYRYANPDAKFTRGEVDGVKGQHITLKLQIESLDGLLFSNDGEGSSTLEDFITEEDSLFGNNITEQYYINYFSKWFNENKERILVKSQLELLENLNKCRKVEGYTINDVQEYTGVPSNKINTRLKRIQHRVLKAWELEKPVFKNRLELERDSKIELLSEFVAIANDDSNLDTQNLRLTNWLKRTFNTTLVMDMLDEIMTKEETILTNRVLQGGSGQIPSTVLYKLLSRVEEALDKLKQADCSTKPVIKKKDPLIQERENNRKIQQQGLVYVYQGDEFDKIIVDVPKRKKNNIVYVLPSGLQVPLSDR